MYIHAQTHSTLICLMYQLKMGQESGTPLKWDVLWLIVALYSEHCIKLGYEGLTRMFENEGIFPTESS